MIVDAPRFVVVQSTTEIGGVEQVLLNLLSASDSLRSSCNVVTLGFGSGDLPSRLRDVGVRVTELAAGRLRQPLNYFRTIRRIAREARSSGAAFIVGNGEHAQMYAGVAARIGKCRNLYFAHSIYPRPFRKRSPVLSAALAMSRDLIVANSEATAESILGIRRAAKVSIVRPGTPRRIVTEDEAAAARREFGARDGDIVFAVFGRLQHWKGQDVFVRAIPLVLRECPNARFAIVGGSVFGLEVDYADALKSQVARLGISDRVLFTGHRTDVSALMRGADVVCHTSRVPEPFGMVIIEAMMQGRPVVATRGGGPDEIVLPGVTGFLTAPDDERELAGRLIELAGDHARRANLGKASLERAMTRYSATRMAEEFRSVLREG